VISLLDPAAAPGVPTKAPMDLGATVCTPANPACDQAALAGATALPTLRDPGLLNPRERRHETLPFR